MKKNQIIKHIRIEKIGYEGVGLGHMPDGKKLIVKGGVLPGMICNLRVVRNRKDYAECHVLDIVSVAKECATGEIKCPHYLYSKEPTPAHKSGCGGCKWQMVAYEQQLEIKHEIVKDSFRHLGKPLEILPVLSSPEIWGYRNKIEYSFGKFVSGRGEDKQILSDWSLGFHRQGMFGKIVDIDQCFLVDKIVNEIFKYAKKLLLASGLPVYDQVQQQGVLRHLLIRQAKRNGQMMLVLSAHSSIKNLGSQLIESLKADELLRSKVDTCILILNDSMADVVSTRDSEFETLWGSGTISEKMEIINPEFGVLDKISGEDFEGAPCSERSHSELFFDISPLSFFQTNSKGAELLYSTAIQMSKDALGSDFQGAVMDLYCGTGTIGLCFLKAGIGSKLIGVEEIPVAIEDAKKNAIRNGILSDYHFFAGKVEKELGIRDSELVIKGGDGEGLRIDGGELGIVIVDPPRSGLHQGAIETLIELKKLNPQLKCCYISCNPVTLARDLKLLLECYVADKVQPVDMFPHTYHVENIVVLS